MNVARARRAGQARLLRIIGGSWRGRRLRFPSRRRSARRRIACAKPCSTGSVGGWPARVPGLFAGSGALGTGSLIARGSARHFRGAGRRCRRGASRRACSNGRPSGAEVQQSGCAALSRQAPRERVRHRVPGPAVRVGLWAARPLLLESAGWLATGGADLCRNGGATPGCRPCRRAGIWQRPSRPERSGIIC